MLQAAVLHRTPLTAKIGSYLAAQEGRPVHYRLIARRLHILQIARVQQACMRMAHAGRLRWCGEGLYAAP